MDCTRSKNKKIQDNFSREVEGERDFEGDGGANSMADSLASLSRAKSLGHKPSLGDRSLLGHRPSSLGRKK